MSSHHPLFSLHNIWLLTPYSRGIPEKLTVPQLVRKFPGFYGTRRFITPFTTARHLFLSPASSIQSRPHPTSLRSILILSSHIRLGLPSGLPPSPHVFWPKPCMHFSSPPYVLHVLPISVFLIWLHSALLYQHSVLRHIITPHSFHILPPLSTSHHV